MTWKGALPWPGFPMCPCGCDAEGMKLQLRHDRHLVGCECPSCRGRRNQRKGKAGEYRRHRRLGGEGGTPHDELAYNYSINITTQDKVGRQVPASFRDFVGSAWAQHALRQAEKKLPVGSDAFPTLYLELTPSDWYLVVKGKGRTLR